MEEVFNVSPNHFLTNDFTIHGQTAHKQLTYPFMSDPKWYQTGVLIVPNLICTSILFVLIKEIFMQAIRQCNKITGVEIKSTHHKTAAITEDLLIIIPRKRTPCSHVHF